MATRAISVKEGLFYILVGGVVVFLAVFLGIRAGFALRGDGIPDELTPENLPNRSHLEVGDLFPEFQVKSIDGDSLNVREVLQNRPTVFVVVLPGCDPCKKLLSEWKSNGTGDGGGRVQIALLAAVPPGELDLGPLAEYASDFPVYFIEFTELDAHCGITSYPSLVGVTGENTVGFVANAYVHQLDMVFFERFL